MSGVSGGNYEPRNDINAQKSGFLERIASGFAFIVDSSKMVYRAIRTFIEEDNEIARQQGNLTKLKRSSSRPYRSNW